MSDQSSVTKEPKSAKVEGSGAIAQGPGAVAAGAGGIAIGGDVIHSIVNTGDHNQFFIGDYERLRDAYIAPWSVFRRVRLDRFTGREWLVTEVDAFLRDENQGYFVLEAAAGLGKTTLLAHLAKDRGYINHFVENTPGPGGIEAGLRNLAAQLVRAWDLDPYLAEGVLPGAASRPDFLQGLLVEAAHKRDQVRPGEDIVLVVDALDEAGVPSGQNALGLPRVLPDGVFFVVSQRPVSVPLRVEGPRRVFRFEAEGNDNLADMRVFLEGAAMWDGIKHELDANSYTASFFVETLLEKCRGVWIYLHYVVDEIERGERSPLDLAALPEDVWQYYAQFWRRWRDRDTEAWYNEHLPLLSTLAAGQEALSLPYLCVLAGVEQQPQLGVLLREKWSPFLTVEQGSDDQRYRLYHASLREFLDGRVESSRLTDAEQRFAEEMADTTREAHGRIADRFLTAWGGLDEGLLHLAEPEKRDVDEGYGLKHLVAHLVGAGRADDVHYLLWLEWQYEETVPWHRQGLGGWLDRALRRDRTQTHYRFENVWYATKEAGNLTSGYLIDVERAWQLGRDVHAVSQSPFSVGVQCFYALVMSSLNTLAENIPPNLLAALVQTEIWTPSQGLAYARRIPDPQKRADALIALAPHIPERELRKGLAVVRGIEIENLRADAVVKLTPHLARIGYIQDMRALLTAAGTVVNEARRAEILEKVIPYLPPSLLDEALAVAREIGDHSSRAKALTAVAVQLSTTERTEVLNEVLNEILTAARSIGEEGERATALADVAPHLSAPDRDAVLLEALAAARVIEDKGKRCETFTSLAANLIEPDRFQILDEALTAARGITDDDRRVQALAELAPHLADPDRAEALKEALSTARASKSDYWRDNALATLSLILAQLDQPGEALLAVRAMETGRHRAETLTRLAPNLPEPFLPPILSALREIDDSYDRAQALAGVAPYLPEPLLREALAVARAIESEWHQAVALAGLVPRLAALDHPGEALTIAHTIVYSKQRSEALTGAASHLPLNERTEVLNEALTDARAIGDNQNRGEALMRLVRELIERGHSEQALKAALAIDDHFWRAKALTMLAPALHEEERPEALQAAWVAAWANTDRVQRTESLLLLLPHLPQAERVELLQDTRADALTIKQDLQRAEALTELAPYLRPEQRGDILEKALASAHEVTDSYWHDKTLSDIGTRSSELGQPEIAIAAARSIRSKERQAETLVKLCLHLRNARRADVFQEALAAARGIPDNYWRDRILADIKSRSMELDQPEIAIAAAIAIHDERERANALVALGPDVPVAQRVNVLQKALETALEIEDDYWRDVTLADIASKSLELGQPRTALATARAIEDRSRRVTSLEDLSTRLAELDHPQDALAAARAIGDRWNTDQALSRLSSQLADLGQPNAALAAARAISDDWKRRDTVRDLTDQLAELGHFQKALSSARTIKEEWPRNETLVQLAVRLAELGHPEKALRLARGAADRYRCAEALVGLAPQLPEPLLRRALETAHEIISEPYRSQALSALVARLAELGHSLEAMEVARTLVDPFWRVQGIAALIPHLPKQDQAESVKQARTTANGLEDDAQRAKALVHLVPHTAQSKRAQVLERALAAAGEIKDDYRRERTLVDMARRLAELGHPEEALAAARAIEAEDPREDALAELARRLAELGHPEGALAALPVIKGVRRASTLAELAPLLAELNDPKYPLEVTKTVLDDLAQTGRSAEHGPGSKYRAYSDSALAELAPRLAELGHADKALAATRAIQDEWLLNQVITESVVHLSELDQLNQVRALALTIEDDRWRDGALTDVVTRLTDLEYADQALATASAILDERQRAETVTKLIPRLAELGRAEDALTAARDIEDTLQRDETLEEMAARFTKLDYFGPALAAAREIQDVSRRIKKLGELAPHLTELPEAQLIPLWQETLSHLARRTRTDLLQDIQALTPVITGLAGAEGITETFDSVQDVGRWWP